MNGGQVRNTLFCVPGRRRVPGYDAEQVNNLCRRVAAELDAGNSARPLVENATFRKQASGLRYDIDAVDWFLDQFLFPPAHVEPGGIAEDPWADLPVARVAQATGEKYAFELQCDSAWHGFGQVPGTLFRFPKTARGAELLTAEQQTLASVRSLWRETFSAGERSFTLQRPSGSPSPAVAEFLARAARDDSGHYAENMRTRNSLIDRGFEPDMRLRELVDETGTPILYTAGHNYNWRAGVCILFPDQRSLRFLVRGSGLANAIMTAVDQAGNKIARYRYIAKSGRQLKHSSWGLAEIIMHPSQKLTDELALALTLSANWFWEYFSYPGEQ